MNKSDVKHFKRVYEKNNKFNRGIQYTYRVFGLPLLYMATALGTISGDASFYYSHILTSFEILES